MTKHEFIRVLVRAAGVSLLGVAAWYTINLIGNLMAVPFERAQPTYFVMFVTICALLAVGVYLIRDGERLFRLLDS